MESKLHRLIACCCADKRYRNCVNMLLCIVSLAMIYRLGYVAGKFIYYVQQNFFPWLLLKYYAARKSSVSVRDLSGSFLSLPERISEVDGKADQIAVWSKSRCGGRRRNLSFRQYRVWLFYKWNPYRQQQNTGDLPSGWNSSHPCP